MDGERLYVESEAICEYLEDRYPVPPLWPADPDNRARARLLTRILDLYVLQPTHRLAAHIGAPRQDQVVIDRLFAEIRKGLYDLGCLLGLGPYAIGTAPVLSGCALAAGLWYLPLVTIKFRPDDLRKEDGRVEEYWTFVGRAPVFCHNSVNERHYALGGDYPVWHWSDLEDDGKLTILRRHTYLENPPKTLHGIRPETRPKIASQMLVWNNGSGTSVFEADAPKETVEVPLGGHATIDSDWNSPRLRIMDDLPWRPHSRIKVWKIKKVASRAKDLSPVVLVNIPMDFSGGAKPPPVTGAPGCWLFVLSGDLSVSLSSATQASQLRLREGHFLSWPKDTILSYPTKKSISDGGCVVLCVGHDLAQSRK